MEGLLASAEDKVKQVPNFQLAQTIYEYRLSPSLELKEKIVEYIRDDSMEKYYTGTHSCLPVHSHALTHIFIRSLCTALCTEFEWALDADFQSTMIEKNSKDLEDIENKLIDAKENHGMIHSVASSFFSILTRPLAYLGDMEVLDMMFKKARHLSQVGDWDAANNGFDEIIKKEKVSTGNLTIH